MEKKGTQNSNKERTNESTNEDKIFKLQQQLKINSVEFENTSSWSLSS